ncbi:unnamed protein product, partial [marine sediment metagenome]
WDTPEKQIPRDGIKLFLECPSGFILSLSIPKGCETPFVGEHPQPKAERANSHATLWT